MFEYLKFILKNLKSFDNKLSNIALLQNKFWVRINDHNLNEKWFFKDNGELIMSINGDIIDGRYEHLNEGNLILEIDKNKILLNQNFIYNDILLLKKDSNETDFYAFYDDSKFTQSQFEKYIETSRKQDLNIQQIQLVDNSNVEVVMNPNQQTISLGNSVLINQELTNLDYVETEYNFYELQEGIIKNIFYRRSYEINNISIVVKQKWKTIQLDDEVVHSSKPIEDGRYKINFNIGIGILENRICSKHYIKFCEPYYKKNKIEIWCRNSKMFSIGDLVFENGKPAINGKYWLTLLKSITVENGKLK